jgi:hypothetical protein
LKNLLSRNYPLRETLFSLLRRGVPLRKKWDVIELAKTEPNVISWAWAFPVWIKILDLLQNFLTRSNETAGWDESVCCEVFC